MKSSNDRYSILFLLILVTICSSCISSTFSPVDPNRIYDEGGFKIRSPLGSGWQDNEGSDRMGINFFKVIDFDIFHTSSAAAETRELARPLENLNELETIARDLIVAADPDSPFFLHRDQMTDRQIIKLECSQTKFNGYSAILCKFLGEGASFFTKKGRIFVVEGYSLYVPYPHHKSNYVVLTYSQRFLREQSYLKNIDQEVQRFFDSFEFTD